jgi:thiamine biosynthesis lipoprotein
MPPYSVSFPALGSTAVVLTTDAAALVTVRRQVEQVVAAIDRACSRFRPDAEIAALGRGRARAVSVSPWLFDAVAAGVRAARLTDGDVDPTLGGALRALGYDRDFDELAARGPANVRATVVPGWRAIELDTERRTVRVPAGVELDLGATAKALAADRAAGAAHAASGCGVLVSLGGDMAAAGPAPEDGWRIRVTDDHRASVTAPGQWIAVHSGGLATSSTSVRRWATAAGTAHHLLDPATGRPADGPWRTVSVTAANIASTAALIRGARAVRWLEQLRLPSRLVTQAGRVLHLAGWPQEGDDLAPAPVPAGTSA